MPSNLSLDYYYGNEAEQYSFYCIPKTLLTDPRYKNVSIEAKVLYGLLLDRMGLSVKSGWMDSERRVYIYFTQEDAMNLMSCGKDKATKLFRELDKDGIGLIERHRLEAMKLLGRTEIECTVSDLDGLQVALAEIDENFVRKDLSDDEFRELLLRRKEIYESLHPETKNGGDRKSEKIRSARCTSDFAKSFVDDTAEKLGVDPSTIRREIQTAKNLTPEAKEIIRDKKSH